MPGKRWRSSYLPGANGCYVRVLGFFKKHLDSVSKKSVSYCSKHRSEWYVKYVKHV